MENYTGLKKAFFTCNLKNKQPFFKEFQIFKDFEALLIESAIQCDCSLLVYVFMPDHCHILIRGNSENSDVYRCMTLFKQKTGYWIFKHAPEFEWQKSFYDHILRKSEDEVEVIKYILNNPVRKRITENWKDYPFKGSGIYLLEDWE